MHDDGRGFLSEEKAEAEEESAINDAAIICERARCR